MTVLFSGRFDPPHPGHIAQIIRLEKQYGRVKIVLLDYPERDYPVEYCVTIFNELLSKYNVEIVVNKTHFAQITLEELNQYNCDLYAAGNLKVLRHIEKLGFPVVYCERSYNYSSRNIERVLD